MPFHRDAATTHVLQASELPAAGEHRYAVLIDAGSSGSRVHIFTYELSQDAAAPYAVVTLPDPQIKTTPGLSSYAPDGVGAGASLHKLIKFAQSEVPGEMHASTSIRLLATAGLRMLPSEQSDAILAEVRGALAASGFDFQEGNARILPGDDEGLYAWAALNYASGKLQNLVRSQLGSLDSPKIEAGQTWGVFELGGASMQLTFLPDTALPEAQAHHLQLPGLHQPLYTHSFLGYGLDVAWFRTGLAVQQDSSKTDPCLPTGYTTEAGIVGSGSFDECLALASAILPAAAAPCEHTQCSIAGEFMPPLSGGFLATENFFYTLQKLGVGGNLTLKGIRAAATEYCGLSWLELRARYTEEQNVPEEHVLKACFGSSYIYTLLKDGFHVPETATFVTYTNIVENAAGEKLDVNWVLGALLVEVIAAEGGQQTGLDGSQVVGKQTAGLQETTPLSGAESATSEAATLEQGTQQEAEEPQSGDTVPESPGGGGEVGESTAADADTARGQREGSGTTDSGVRVDGTEGSGVGGSEGGEELGGEVVEWHMGMYSWRHQLAFLVALVGIVMIGMLVASKTDAVSEWRAGATGSGPAVAYKRAPGKETGDEEMGISLVARSGKGA
ncbi:MAG: hypothetical protein WDW38_010234 [Sanguina aurantia]